MNAILLSDQFPCMKKYIKQYGKKGDKVRVISMDDKVALVESINGIKFPVLITEINIIT